MMIEMDPGVNTDFVPATESGWEAKFEALRKFVGKYYVFAVT
jgi:hypothetical protein